MAAPSLDDHFQLFCRFVENKSNDGGHISLSLTVVSQFYPLLWSYMIGVSKIIHFEGIVDIDMPFEH